MIDRMTSRGALAATTGLVAAAVALMLALPQNQINLPPLGGIGMGENGPINPTTREITAPVTEAEAPIVAADEFAEEARIVADLWARFLGA